MNLRSIHQRHFLLTAGMILISFLMLGVSFLALTYRFAVRETKNTLDTNAVFIANVTTMFLEQGFDMEDLQTHDAFAYLSSTANAEVVICDENGAILYSDEPENMEERPQRRQVPFRVLRGIDDDGYQTMSDLGIYGHSKFVVAMPIVYQQQVAGYVFVTASTENLTRMWRSFGVIFGFTAAAVLIIAWFSCYFSTRQQIQPLRDLTDIINRFGMGEYDLRAEEKQSSEEVEQLARAFNVMADSIASAEQRRQEFVANISHELKTPMTTISGFTDGILDGTIPPAQQRECLQVVSEETRRLSRLVRRMLDMSQLSAREQEVLCQSQFNITETFAQVLISLERKITSRGLDVDAQFPDQDVMVWGDPDAITQVCYNLLDNAIKFAEPGSFLGVSIQPKGNKAWISVRDKGETIPPEELSMIFDRFHKSDRSRSLDKEGVGLGLYIVKTILNNHKETITVTSEDGITEFRFSLTLAE
ncbi:MAG: HAMP domain-containing histidine kinase [Oscillospiraceae bacterium]|nr:HAMP domain-containing histidine kinase [Oscillospiraceae bacterium]